jgi:hypothetical protein
MECQWILTNQGHARYGQRVGCQGTRIHPLLGVLCGAKQVPNVNLNKSNLTLPKAGYQNN